MLVAAGFAGMAAAQDKPSNSIPCSAIDSIGMAEMANDGTITLHLRSLWPDPIAEGELVYAPDDPQYARHQAAPRRHRAGRSQAGEAVVLMTTLRSDQRRRY